MQYLEGEEPSVEDMKKVLRKATCECTAVPVCCGSAYRNKGVQKLLDAIVEYMPAPTDIPSIKGTDLEGNEIERHSSDDEHSQHLHSRSWQIHSRKALHSSVFTQENVRQVLMY